MPGLNLRYWYSSLTIWLEKDESDLTPTDGNTGVETNIPQLS